MYETLSQVTMYFAKPTTKLESALSQSGRRKTAMFWHKSINSHANFARETILRSNANISHGTQSTSSKRGHICKITFSEAKMKLTSTFYYLSSTLKMFKIGQHDGPMLSVALVISWHDVPYFSWFNMRASRLRRTCKSARISWKHLWDFESRRSPIPYHVTHCSQDEEGKKGKEFFPRLNFSPPKNRESKPSNITRFFIAWLTLGTGPNMVEMCPNVWHTVTVFAGFFATAGWTLGSFDSSSSHFLAVLFRSLFRGSNGL